VTGEDDDCSTVARGLVLLCILRHPALALLLLAASIWNVWHWPPLRHDAWPPEFGPPTLEVGGSAFERRPLAWAYRDNQGWRFEISPGEDDGWASCTINVLIHHGSYGWPFPTKTGSWSVRAVMNQREAIAGSELDALYGAAADFLRTQPGAPEAAFIAALRRRDLVEMRPVPLGIARNIASIALLVMGACGGVWCCALAAASATRSVHNVRIRRRASAALRAEMCPGCGYDWRSLPHKRCPECGFHPAAGITEASFPLSG
jgi:hypothetical protein